MRSQRGSVSVELAAVLPLLAIVMLLVAQVGLVVAEQLAVQHAAREGARTAAIMNDDDAARQAAVRAGNLRAPRATISIDPARRAVGEPVRVRVSYRVTVIPVVERFVPSGLSVAASATMRTERAPS